MVLKMSKALLIGCLGLLSEAVAGCGGGLKMPPAMKMRHQYDNAYRQQEKLLNAEEVNVSVHRTQVAVDSAINRLDLLVFNPKDLSAAPDSVRRRARKLAHLVVADLANPQDYQVMTVTIAEKHDYFIAQTSNRQTITYSIANLK
jgi:hypothetical protein